MKKARIIARGFARIYGFIEEEDLIAYLYTELFLYLPDYDPKRGVSWGKYLNSILATKAIQYLYKEMRYRGSVVLSGLGADADEETDEHEDMFIDETNVEENALQNIIIKEVFKTATNKERIIMRAIMEGYSLREIATRFNMHHEKIRRMLKRLRKVL